MVSGFYTVYGGDLLVTDSLSLAKASEIGMGNTMYESTDSNLQRNNLVFL